MFRNLFAAAIFAALCAGLVFTVIQQVRLTPLILTAETYENAPEAAPADATTAAPAEDHGAHEQWAPQDGFERTAYTVLANLLAAAGYALIIAAVSTVAGIPITRENGVLWGLGAFATFSLVPAFGLPPGLPGMPVADTFARQIWWWSAALATGAAILLYAKVRAPWTLAAGAVLIALPQLIGAPQPPAEPSAVPPYLSSSFAASVLVANAAMWVALGLAMGFASDWLARRAASAAPARARAA